MESQMKSTMNGNGIVDGMWWNGSIRPGHNLLWLLPFLCSIIHCWRNGLWPAGSSHKEKEVRDWFIEERKGKSMSASSPGQLKRMNKNDEMERLKILKWNSFALEGRSP